MARRYTKDSVETSYHRRTEGAPMVNVNETGRIYGIKAYGVIHRGHYYGTLDEFETRQNWGRF